LQYYKPFRAASAASLPVIMETGSPEGLKTHCPAWNTSGIAVSTDREILDKPVSTGISLLSNPQPVIAPSELPCLLKSVSGVEEN
jgi:hypothetical protein